jgi:hypothetical protein
MKMLENSEYVTTNPKAVKEILISVCSILFGVSTQNINTDLINISFKAISDRFIGITIQDIKNAFSDAEIDKKQYISITRDELINPIKVYWSKKITLLSKIKEVENQIESENESKIMRERFEVESMQIFQESLNQKKWLGTPVNAFSILSQHKAKGIVEITGKFEQAEKDELYQQCLRENNSAKHIELDKCEKEEVSKWLEKLVDPKWLFANELIKLYFERHGNI